MSKVLFVPVGGIIEIYRQYKVRNADGEVVDECRDTMRHYRCTERRSELSCYGCDLRDEYIDCKNTQCCMDEREDSECVKFINIKNEKTL